MAARAKAARRVRALARTLTWLTGPPLALLVALFAVANRQTVALELWPLPWSVTLPLYLAVLGALAIGLMAGAAAVSIACLAARRRAAQEKRRADSLARQLAAARALPADPPT